MNEDYSQFFDANSQICLNEESFVVGAGGENYSSVQTPNNQNVQMINMGGGEKHTADKHMRNPSQQSAFTYNQLKPKATIEEAINESLQNLAIQSRPAIAQPDLQETQKEVKATDILRVEDVGLELSEIQCRTPPEMDGDSVLIITAHNSQMPKEQPTAIKPIVEVPIILDKPQAQTTKSTNPNTTWTKVTFAKRKTSTSVVTNQGTQQTSECHSAMLSKHNPAAGLSQKLLAKQHSLPVKAQTKKKNPFADGEPLPVFDCLFCCQEHFVLNKINEMSLINKYANHKPSYESQRDGLMMNMMVVKKMNPGRLVEAIIDADPIISAYQENTDKISDLKSKINSLSIQSASQTPKIPKLEYYLVKIKNFQSTAHQLPLQKSNVYTKPQKKQSNFLGFTDEDAEALQNESNVFGANGMVHFRTRRQRILENISFETDYHNIFDPCYTSEEERDSVDSNSDEVSEENSVSEDYYDNEEESEEDEDDDEELSCVSVDEEEELKEIVNEYQRSEERKKKQQKQFDEVTSLSPSPIKQVAEDTRGNQSISSIEQHTDEDGFSGSDHEREQEEPQQDTIEEATTPITDLTQNVGGCVTNPLSFINATTSNHAITSNNLNIQENTIEKAEEDDDSERYTFGCVTPKADGEVMSLQGVLPQGRMNFSNGDQSLSPVRAQSSTHIDRPLQFDSRQAIRATNPKNEYCDQMTLNKRSPSLHNPMMLDISPVSYNAKQKSYIGDGSKNGLVHSINDGDGFSLRGAKIDFYPPQDLDSLEEMHITNGPTLVQQKSYEEGTSDFTANQQQLLMLSKTDDLDFTNLGAGQIVGKRLSQFSKSYQSDANHPDEQHYYETTQQVMTQYYNNQPPENQAHQSQSFTAQSKFKHQRLIPSQSQPQTITETTPENRHASNTTLDAHLSMRNQFLLRQDQFQEILKKAKMFKNGKTGMNPQHLASFDSMQNGKHFGSIYDTEDKSNQKQKTQAICTPIDTNDQVMLAFPQSKVNQFKTNKTTINQNARRQGSANGGQLFIGSCKNGTSSQSNILIGNGIQSEACLPDNNNLTNIFTVRKMNEFNSTKTFQSTGKSQTNKNQKLSETIMPLLLAYDNLGVKGAQANTTKASAVKMKQHTQSPSIMKMVDNKMANPSGLQKLNVDQLTKKEINQFLKSALVSSRYASTSGFNNLFKQSQEVKASSLVNPSHQESLSKSLTKKKKKTKQSKNQTLTSVVETSKKTQKAKKGKKTNSKGSKGQSFNDHSSNQYGFQHQSQQDLQAYINICNSMNFSNDYSIPSIISGGTSQINPIAQKSISMNQGHLNNKSSQNALMYLSMQDGKNLFSAGNNSNIQDTSNNYPYGGSIQAEMSTCISQGQQTLSTTRGGIRKASNKTTPNANHCQPVTSETQKLNGSLEEMNLFSLLSALGGKKGQKTKEVDKNSAQRTQQVNHQRSVERAGSQTLQPPETDLKNKPIQPSHHQGQFSFSQRDFQLNQTTDLQKTGFHAKRKSKGQTSQTFNSINMNAASHTTTVKNTTLQNQRRDNKMRTRSSSKSSNAIKTDQPTHQLLLQNQINFPLQMKNKQMLLGMQSNHQTVQKELNKTNTQTSKSKKLVKDESHLRTKNQSRVSNKSINQGMDNLIQHQLITGFPYSQDLSKLYGTGKILMSNVTSPLRPLASHFTSGVGHSINFGPNEKAALSLIKNDLFQTQSKDDRRK